MGRSVIDHEYKAGWLSAISGKACKVCGKGRGDHWKPLEGLWDQFIAPILSDPGYDDLQEARKKAGDHETD